jgi:hypothetical protein
VTTRPASGLLQALQQVPDPRGRQGLRHPLPAMLASVVCAVMSGFSSYEAIAQWIHAQDASFWHTLGFRRRPPGSDCFRKLLNRLCPQQVETVLRQWIGLEDRPPDSPPEDEDSRPPQPQTIDGKRLRGTRQKWERAWDVLTRLDHQTGCVCSQAAVSPETNEHKAALTLLKSLLLKGKVIVADAAYCQRDVCQTILQQEGDYLVLVKDNQQVLHHDVQQAFVIPKGFSPLPGALGA